jgi:hypothetical protein
MKSNIFIFLLFSVSFSQFSPGDLSDPHAFLSGNQNCDQCHSKGKSVDNDDCTDCHLTIKKSIKNKNGYHGGNNLTDCYICHSDHNGSAFSMIYWEDGQDKFDHSKTGYDLDGKHIGLECEKCHKSEFIREKDVIGWETEIRSSTFLDKTFLGLSPNCLDCHEDVHKSELQDKPNSLFLKPCADCHNTSSWNTASETLDHSKTLFELKKSHKKVKCIQCHFPKDKPEKLDILFSVSFEKGCVDCHKDIHNGVYGENCSKCHDEDDWKKALPFDHNKTDFSLLGKHQQVKCSLCHKSETVINKDMQCNDCHKDIHNGGYGTTCAKCHDETDWKQTKGFNHDVLEFPLTGQHKIVKCEKCHILDKILIKKPFCYDCHIDIHQNQFASNSQLKDCTYCHDTRKWKPSQFSINKHKQTKFPLTGGHLAVPCFLCHSKPIPDSELPVQFSGISQNCQACHEDIHYLQFADESNSTVCQKCHMTSQWRIQAFDHNTTRYKLDGKHQKVDCEKCHKKVIVSSGNIDKNYVRYRPIAHDCKDCHMDEFKKPNGYE